MHKQLFFLLALFLLSLQQTRKVIQEGNASIVVRGAMQGHWQVQHLPVQHGDGQAKAWCVGKGGHQDFYGHVPHQLQMLHLPVALNPKELVGYMSLP